MADYRFLTTWIVDAPGVDVWNTIYEAERWPEWWPGVVEVVKTFDGDDNGVGSTFRNRWRSVLPYAVEFDVVTTRVEAPHLIELDADGGLAGNGRLAPLPGRRGRGHVRVERPHHSRLDERAGAVRAARVRVEPQRDHAPRRPRHRAPARHPTPRPELGLGFRGCASWSPAPPGS
jgi:hypothetical protein